MVRRMLLVAFVAGCSIAAQARVTGKLGDLARKDYFWRACISDHAVDQQVCLAYIAGLHDILFVSDFTNNTNMFCPEKDLTVEELKQLIFNYLTANRPGSGSFTVDAHRALERMFPCPR